MSQHLPLVGAGQPGAELTAGQDGATIRRTVLPGGVRVLTEEMPGLRSATVGAWVGVGSRDETDGHHGSTHFLEHLLFKGTHRRSALDIAEAFDAVGGEANAATGKEHTCYYARVLDDDLPMAVDVITDMVTSARLDADELETERGVILEELAMTEDDPAEVVHERFAEVVLGSHALGRPIGGTADTIRAVPARPCGTTTPGTTARRLWWSPRRAASTTTVWSRRSARRWSPAAGTWTSRACPARVAARPRRRRACPCRASS